MSLLHQIGLLVCQMYGDKVPNYTPIERWALKNSKLCSADDIIAAAVIKSFADSYDDWSRITWNIYENGVPSSEVLPVGCSWYDVDTKLTNTKKSFKIYWKYINLAGKRPFRFNMFVNGVSITNDAAEEIQKAYYEIKVQRDAIATAAAKAKAEMERNEAAWNLAESLLGMRRNEFGALVPVTAGEIK